MTEKFLHYVWQYGLFNQQDLTTHEGEKVVIIKRGTYNENAGPDFTNARIQIGETEWAGNVEIHVFASDWLLHKHSSNLAYDSVILHVVLENDNQLFRKDGSAFPVIVLKDKLNWTTYETYSTIMQSKQWIPCASSIGLVSALHRNAWLERILVARLERKSLEMEQLLLAYRGSFEEVFYVRLARNFGFNVNAEPFEQLARNLPLNLLAKHRNSILQTEAILFGQAGFLDEMPSDSYHNELITEYRYLKQKLGLISGEKHAWKFSRLRPYNFPTVRLAQFASLVYHSNGLLSKLLECDKISDVKNRFLHPVSDYWKTHFRFGITARLSEKNLSESVIENIIINTLVPMLFLLAKQKDDAVYTEKALRFLEETSAEKNHITEKFALMGFRANSAFESQGQLELKNSYCNAKRCLECGIGLKILGA